MIRIAVLVSGGGTNLQALLDAVEQKKLVTGKVVLVLSSNRDALALQRAQKEKIPCCVVERKKHGALDEFDAEILRVLQNNKVELVVLAGFLSIVGSLVLKEYKGRIVNIHPSLLPAFGGSGYYGLKVHEAALNRGVKVTGATVHLVNEIVDGGEILLQKAVDILPDDSPESLQKRVMEQAEWKLLPQAVEEMCLRLSHK